MSDTTEQTTQPTRMVDFKFTRNRAVADLKKFREIVDTLIKDVEEGDVGAYEHFLFEREASGSMSSLWQLMAIRHQRLIELRGQPWPYQEGETEIVPDIDVLSSIPKDLANIDGFVWMVTNGDVHDFTVYRIFENEEAARKYRDDFHPGAEIDLWEVEVLAPELHTFRATAFLEGDAEPDVVQTEGEEEGHTQPISYVRNLPSPEYRKGSRISCTGRTAEHAKERVMIAKRYVQGLIAGAATE